MAVRESDLNCKTGGSRTGLTGTGAGLAAKSVDGRLLCPLRCAHGRNDKTIERRDAPNTHNAKDTVAGGGIAAGGIGPGR